MESEGIELSAAEGMPTDPYTQTRHLPTYSYTAPSTYDKLKQFLEMDRHVLRFFCVWDDRDSMFGEMKPYVSNLFSRALPGPHFEVHPRRGYLGP